SSLRFNRRRSVTRFFDHIVIADRQRKEHACALPVATRLDPDLSVVRFHDALGDREAHARAGGLPAANVTIARRTEELIKDSLAQVSRNSRSAVFNSHFN